MNTEPDFVEGSYKTLQNHIEKLTENQKNIIAKFDNLSKNVEDFKKVLSQFSDKIVAFEDVSKDKKKLKAEIKVLKNRIDELYAIVKEGKEDNTSCPSDVQDVESCHSGFSCSSKVTMTTGIDRDTIRSAYEDVRSDATPTEWAVFKFEGARIVCSARGSDFTEFRTQFADDERAFGYLRLQMGDEMSKRRKFLFVTWVGPNVSVINRAKMSTDKAIIKDIISNFAVELQLESQAEIDIDQFKDTLNRAGGANYGTGIRDL
ncbi:coactosin-like protein isoform X1 [Plodia interpunctella]|uniref:coactosin-like protein isoform X1 n=1 Tax=Plodia interpunctella TaxID=58824 RepID=UPI00236823A1|nr:coactosin-like protein isoform X1 [Plodia interpunctella]